MTGAESVAVVAAFSILAVCAGYVARAIASHAVTRIDALEHDDDGQVGPFGNGSR